MKRLRVYLIALVLTPIVAFGALFFIPGPDGQPLLNMERLRQSFDRDGSPIEKVKALFNNAKNTIVNVKSKDSPPTKSKKNTKFNAPIEAPPETLFKWRDKNGNWHYSNQLPPEGVDFEIVKDE